MSPANPVIKMCKRYVGPQKNNILKNQFEINDGFITEKEKKGVVAIAQEVEWVIK